MKIAVTGPESCLGSRLVEALHLGDGASVAIVAEPGAPTTLAARFSVDPRPADPLSIDSLRKSFERCNSAIHTGAGPAVDPRRSATTFARAAAAAGVRRAIYVSALPLPAPEAHPSATPGREQNLDEEPMDRRQAAAERQFLAESRDAGLNAFVIRTGIVYGPRCRLIGDIATELRESRAWLLRDGATVFNGAYVDNVVSAIRLCLRTKATLSQPAVIADAETASWRDLYHLIARDLEQAASHIRYFGSAAEAAQEPQLGISSAAAAERGALQSLTAKLEPNTASKALGYQPSVAFADGVHRSCQWWRFAQGEFEPAA